MKKIKQIITVVALAIFMLGSFVGSAQSFDKIGLEHNQILRTILPKIDYSLKKTNLIQDVINLTNNELNKKTNKLNIFLGLDVSVFNSPELLLNALNKKQKINSDLYNLVLNSIQTIQSKASFQDINMFVETQKKAKHNLPAKDFDLYLGFLSTLKHSSEFWAVNGENGKKYIVLPTSSTSPKGKGGPNPSNYEVITHTSAMMVNWWKVAGCDAVGALFGGPGPAAVASGCSVIMQL